MNFEERLDKLIERHGEIGERLNDGQLQADDRARLSKEYADFLILSFVSIAWALDIS